MAKTTKIPNFFNRKKKDSLSRDPRIGDLNFLAYVIGYMERLFVQKYILYI